MAEKNDSVIMVRLPTSLKAAVNAKAEAKREDDPEFSVAGLIRKSLRQWVAK